MMWMIDLFCYLVTGYVLLDLVAAWFINQTCFTVDIYLSHDKAKDEWHATPTCMHSTTLRGKDKSELISNALVVVANNLRWVNVLKKYEAKKVAR